jgi:signal transduction histidine kinase
VTAAAIVADASANIERAVANLRARARSDAAIVVVLSEEAPVPDVRKAYEAGALLCVRPPIDEDHLRVAIRSAMHLQTAEAQANDLVRQLDVQAHLASLGRVTANFTHELSNPLAVLMSNFELISGQIAALLTLRDVMACALREGTSRETTDAARRLLSDTAAVADLQGAVLDMGGALERMSHVLTLVRSLARGGMDVRVQEVDLASVVRDVRRWAAAELEGIDVEEIVDGPVVARADPRLLGQILLNLVTNAAHAARPLPSPRIRLHVYGSKDAVVSVRDNGPGVPPEIRDRIFEPFFTTRRGQGGTGLGLALCREYANQMQAQLTLWTAPGRGACFRVHLRRATP